MRMDHRKQITEQLAHLAASFINRESNRTSLITVTRATLSNTSNAAHIFITVLPEKEQQNAMIFLKRSAGMFREYLKEHAGMHRIPHINFQHDVGEVNRQKMDVLFNEIHTRSLEVTSSQSLSSHKKTTRASGKRIIKRR